MTTYKELTATDIQTIQNTFSDLLPKDMNAQIKTFPTKSVFDGIKAGLDPQEIGNNVYNEMAALNSTQFEDVNSYDSANWARFCQAAIQKVLVNLIAVDGNNSNENDSTNVDGGSLDVENGDDL